MRTPSADPADDAPPTLRIALVFGTLVALTIIGSSAVAVALPELAADLDLDVAGTSWVLAAFGLAFAVATTFFGRLADVLGMRRPLLLGVALLAIGSLTAATAPSFEVLVAGRVLQGAGTGAVPLLVTGTINARFQGAARTHVLGAIGMVVSVVSGSGPLIGGAVTELTSWRVVVAIPLLAVVLAPVAARLAPDHGDPRQRLDPLGAVAVGLAVAGATVLVQAPGGGLTAGTVMTTAAVATVATLVAVVHLRRRRDGFLPVAIVSDRRLLRVCAAGFSLLASWLAMLLAVPEILASAHGWSPLVVGAVMLPGAALGAVASRVVSTRVVRRGDGTRRDRGRVVSVLVGSAVAGLVLAGLAAPAPAAVVLGFGLVAVAFAAGQVVLLDLIPSLVPPHRAGVALGVFHLAFFSGGAFGSAAAGGLAGLTGLPGALLVVAVLPVLGAAAARGAAREAVAASPAR